MTPHRWTLTVLTDGSGIALSEWRSEYEYREHTPSRAKPGPWQRDDACASCAGVSRHAASEISCELAHIILCAWRTSRKCRIGGWIDL